MIADDDVDLESLGINSNLGIDNLGAQNGSQIPASSKYQQHLQSLLCKTATNLARYVRNRSIPSVSLRRTITAPQVRSKAMARLIRPSHRDTS